MQMRRPGKTDLELSVVGFGGVVVMNMAQREADRAVADAFDRGVRYFDVAPSYQEAESILGPALRPYRDRVVLACKTGERSAEGARRELDSSLAKLRTDRFEIYQAHALHSVDEAKTFFGPGGAIEAFLEARKAGKVRYLGFSAHDQDAALHMVATGLFDTVLFPLNILMFEQGGFGPALLEAANARGMGVMALKSMARTAVPEGGDKPYQHCWYEPEDRPEVAHLMLRYTLNLPGVSAALPPGDPGLFRMALGFAEQVGPLTDDELTRLRDEMAQIKPLFPRQYA